MWKTCLRSTSNWSKTRYATCLVLFCSLILYGFQRQPQNGRSIACVTLSDGSEIEAALTRHCREALRRLPNSAQPIPVLTISRERQSGAKSIKLSEEQSRRVIEALRSQRSFRHNEPCLCIAWCSIDVPLNKTESLLISFHIHPSAALSYFCGETYESIDVASETFDAINKVVAEVIDPNARPY